MRPVLFALLLLSACAPTTDDGFTGIVDEPATDGLLAIIHDGTRIQAAGTEDGLVPVSGRLHGISELWTENEMVLSGNDVSVEAMFGDTIDLTSRTPITQLSFSTQLFPDTLQFEGIDYSLGPEGGSLWFTEIEQKSEGGYRVRGQFTGQICPQDDPSTGCHDLQGVFAFDETELPPAAVIGDLISPPS